jgi:hypothetical protein
MEPCAFFDPLGDAGNFEMGHKDKRPEHARGRARRTSLYRRIEALDELAARIKLKMGEDHELGGEGFQSFPELTIVIGKEFPRAPRATD